MTLHWRPNGGHTPLTPSLIGLDDEERMLAQVVRYDNPPGWKAFVRGYPVGGTWDELASAQRVAENCCRVRRP